MRRRVRCGACTVEELQRLKVIATKAGPDGAPMYRLVTAKASLDRVGQRRRAGAERELMNDDDKSAAPFRATAELSHRQLCKFLDQMKEASDVRFWADLREKIRSRTGTAPPIEPRPPLWLMIAMMDAELPLPRVDLDET